MFDNLAPYHMVLETLAAVILIFAVTCAIVGMKNRNWYKPAFILSFCVAIIWLVGCLIEYGMNIPVEGMITVLLSIVMLFLANIWFKKAYDE